MKKNNYESNIYFWFKNDDSLIIKKRIFNRIFAILTTVFTAPGMIALFIIFFLYSEEMNFKNNTETYIVILFTTLYCLIPIISFISIFWIPKKISFNTRSIEYYPYSYFPFVKLIIDYWDIESIEITQKKIINGSRGIGFIDFNSFLVLNTKNKSYNLVKIKSKIVPNYYNQLKEEIQTQIKKNNI